jgi:hypothetical protein
VGVLVHKVVELAQLADQHLYKLAFIHKLLLEQMVVVAVAVAVLTAQAQAAQVLQEH